MKDIVTDMALRRPSVDGADQVLGVGSIRAAWANAKSA